MTPDISRRRLPVLCEDVLRRVLAIVAQDTLGMDPTMRHYRKLVGYATVCHLWLHILAPQLYGSVHIYHEVYSTRTAGYRARIAQRWVSNVDAVQALGAARSPTRMTIRSTCSPDIATVASALEGVGLGPAPWGNITSLHLSGMFHARHNIDNVAMQTSVFSSYIAAALPDITELPLIIETSFDEALGSIINQLSTHYLPRLCSINTTALNFDAVRHSHFGEHVSRVEIDGHQLQSLPQFAKFMSHRLIYLVIHQATMDISEYFYTDGGLNTVHFPNLEVLELVFDSSHSPPVSISRTAISPSFPKLRNLTVHHSLHVYTDLYSAFAGHCLDSVYLYENDGNFDCIDFDVIRNATEFTIHIDDTRIGTGSIDPSTLSRLFTTESHATHGEIHVSTIGGMLPTTVQWENMQHLTLGGMSYLWSDLERLILQLPRLWYLCIDGNISYSNESMSELQTGFDTEGELVSKSLQAFTWRLLSCDMHSLNDTWLLRIVVFSPNLLKLNFPEECLDEVRQVIQMSGRDITVNVS